MTTMSDMTITEFLLARIAEDEEVARAALPIPDLESPRWLPANLKRRFGIISGYEVDHIARHDPSRVLRECAAKRAIIEAAEHGYLSYVAPLAAVYSDHPDYREEWRW